METGDLRVYLMPLVAGSRYYNLFFIDFLLVFFLDFLFVFLTDLLLRFTEFPPAVGGGSMSVVSCSCFLTFLLFIPRYAKDCNDGISTGLQGTSRKKVGLLAQLGKPVILSIVPGSPKAYILDPLIT